MKRSKSRIPRRYQLIWLTCLSTLCVFISAQAQSGVAAVQPGQKTKTCMDRTGFDPKNPGVVNERELARGEKTYLSCVYARIREEIIPNSPVPEAYREFIKQYQQMSGDIVVSGTTRSLRAQRAGQLLDAIAKKEQAASANAATALTQSNSTAVRQMLGLPAPTSA